MLKYGNELLVSDEVKGGIADQNANGTAKKERDTNLYGRWTCKP